MSQSKSSSSSSAQDLLDALINSRQLVGTASSAAHVSPVGAGLGSSRKYVFSFVMLVLVTTIGNLYKPCFFLQWLVHNRQKFALAER